MHVAGIGLTAPLRGRLLDRLGSRRLIPPMSLLHAATVVALPVVAPLDATWLLALVAFAAGACIPPLVPAMRLEWQRMVGEEPALLTRAYAFETSLQLTVFLVGPLLAAGMLAVAGPTLPLLASAALAALGGPLFAVRARAVPAREVVRARGAGSIASPGVRTLVVVTALADAALGVVDVSVVAAATERGHPAAAGVLLALFTLGSVAGASAYGSRSWRRTPYHRLVVSLLLFTVALVLVGTAGPLVLFAVLLVVAGAPSAAQWVTTSVALDAVTPEGQAAEAFTWLSSANAGGIALGGVLGGAVVDARGAGTAITLSAGLTLLAALVLVARRASLR